MNANLPRYSNYGQYASSNYGAHTLRFDLGKVTVWFSYSTVVAFRVDGHDRVVHQNDWSTTTGKHLKWIDGGSAQAKKARVDDETFQRLWKEQAEPILNPPESAWTVGALSA